MAFVIRKPVVARSLARLRTQKTHPLFAGYLYLQERASQLGRLNDLQPDFSSFYKRFLRVGDHPLGFPYIKPFTAQIPSANNMWLNENVAGSYAPSSLRTGQPFRRVVEIEDGAYSLLSEHARLAFEHLLYKKQIQVADLAVVLYRDYSLLDKQPVIQDLIDIFAYEFGYSSAPGGSPDQSFNLLYTLESARVWYEDWLEAL